MSNDSRQNDLLQTRYGDQKKPNKLIVNPTIDVLLSHRSVRSFLEKPLPDGAIETMVAAAQSAATSSNLHQWSTVAVTDPELKRQVWELASGKDLAKNKFILQAPVLFLWVADLSRSNEIVKESGEELVVHDYLDSFVMATVDATLAAQNAAVAAESIGLGYCYIGATRNHAQQLADLLRLPKHSYVTFGFAVGYPDESANASIRPRPVQDVVLHINHYDAEKSRNGLETYESAYQQFRERLGLSPKTWNEAVVNSTKFSYMSGREKLRAAVSARGFLLK